MLYRIAADAVLALHLAFIVFALLGGVLVLRWSRLLWLHVPAAAWAAFIELSGGICPLTPLEVALRRAGGEAGYSGDFLEHYLVAVIYPEGLTYGVQIVLGAVVILVNVAIYATILRRSRLRRGRA
ncbi:MAG TPA: DUF2784 domain-containing protein [Casimicrobiaceae bacterium]